MTKYCKCGCNQIVTSKTALYIRWHHNNERIGKSIDEIYGNKKANILRNKLRFKTHKKKNLSIEEIQKQKEYRNKNKDKLFLYTHNWRIKNKEHNKNYKNWKRQINIQFKLIENLRARMGRAIKYNDAIKSDTTIKLIGCDLDILKQYLENKFKDGMSWNNYGEWHIDHILPCASFDLVNEEEQKKCFHYKNLQPLWAQDNYKKSSKILS